MYFQIKRKYKNVLFRYIRIFFFKIQPYPAQGRCTVAVLPAITDEPKPCLATFMNGVNKVLGASNKLACKSTLQGNADPASLTQGVHQDMEIFFYKVAAISPLIEITRERCRDEPKHLVS